MGTPPWVIVLSLLYPIIIYWAWLYNVPSVAAVGLIVLALIRLKSLRRRMDGRFSGARCSGSLNGSIISANAGFVWQCLGGIAIIVLAVLAMAIGAIDDMLQWYPILINSVCFIVFASSLFSPPSIIERVARLAEPNLSAAGVRYTRMVTQVWCVFFVLNGGVSAYTVLACTWEAWLFYNGFLNYVLMGALFAGEWCVRPYFKRRSERA